MSTASTSNVLLVAGGRPGISVGWAVTEAWLERDPLNEVFTTFKSDKTGEAIGKYQNNNPNGDRLTAVQANWTDPTNASTKTSEALGKLLDGRKLAGAVHAIAHSDPKSFKNAHNHSKPTRVDDVVDAFKISTASLFGLANLVKPHLEERAGIVAFGFGKSDSVTPSYGVNMSVTKAALESAIKHLGYTMGRTDEGQDPTQIARTALINPGFIPTDSGNAVAYFSSGVARNEADQAVLKAIGSFEAGAAIVGSTWQLQLEATAFCVDPMFRQSTGIVIPIDGGFSLFAPQGL
jgi:enoyl-[acyl-carrier-protein] reductase (NADH)